MFQFSPSLTKDKNLRHLLGWDQQPEFQFSPSLTKDKNITLDDDEQSLIGFNSVPL